MRQIGTTGKICIADMRELPVGQRVWVSGCVSGPCISYQDNSALTMMIKITTIKMNSSGTENLCIGSSRMCEPRHTLRSDTGHSLQLLQYDSTRFAPCGLGQKSHEPAGL
jgi:hypothetical protein